jgi:hypothetical protein
MQGRTGAEEVANSSESELKDTGIAAMLLKDVHKQHMHIERRSAQHAPVGLYAGITPPRCIHTHTQLLDKQTPVPIYNVCVCVCMSERKKTQAYVCVHSMYVSISVCLSESVCVCVPVI